MIDLIQSPFPNFLHLKIIALEENDFIFVCEVKS